MRGLTDAVTNRVRYHTRDENDETRWDRNERFEHENPEHYTELIPEAGKYIWEWYHELSAMLKRTTDGACIPIPPSEYIAWRDLRDHVIYQWEIDILLAMDLAFCAQMGEELKAYQERQKEAMKTKGK